MRNTQQWPKIPSSTCFSNIIHRVHYNEIYDTKLRSENRTRSNRLPHPLQDPLLYTGDFASTDPTTALPSVFRSPLQKCKQFTQVVSLEASHGKQTNPTIVDNTRYMLAWRSSSTTSLKGSTCFWTVMWVSLMVLVMGLVTYESQTI